MNKKKLLTELTARVGEDLDKAILAAKASSEGAIHEENRAEGNKDMRSTEASYLARGQSMRVEELEDTLNRLGLMNVAPFGDDAPVSVGALVCLETEDGALNHYWLVTGAAGYELSHGDNTITTITPQSPLGKELVEKRVGDDVDLHIGGGHRQLEIVSIE